MDVDSEDGLEAAALANTVIPETVIPDIYGEAVGERHTLPDPRSVHPAFFAEGKASGIAKTQHYRRSIGMR